MATRLAIWGNTPKAKIVAELYGRLSLLLVRANAQSILCRSYPQTPQQENELITSLFCVFVGFVFIHVFMYVKFNNNNKYSEIHIVDEHFPHKVYMYILIHICNIHELQISKNIMSQTVST